LHKKSSRTEYSSPCVSRGFACINPPDFERYLQFPCNFTTLKNTIHPLFVGDGDFFRDDYLEKQGMTHTRGAPYHPMTQGKIERYHRSMKNVVKLQNYYFPWELEQELSRFVDYYNNHRYHESLNNVTPSDVYFDRHREILTKRDQIKRKTLDLRRKQNLKSRVA